MIIYPLMRILITTPKDAYATRRFQEEASGLGLEVVCMDLESLAKRNWQVDLPYFDALWVRQANPYYNEVIQLARAFSSHNKLVVDNRIPELGIQDNKFELVRSLVEQGITMPRTERFAPMASAGLEYPFVLKWMYGAGAKHVYLVEEEKRLAEILKQYPAGELIQQEYIAADFEYNVITVGYKSLPVVVQYKTHPFKKVTDLEQFEVVKASAVPELIQLAEQGSRILGRELAKADIVEKNGKLYVLEINRTPGLKPFEQATGVNVAKEFLQYIVAHISGSNV